MSERLEEIVDDLLNNRIELTNFVTESLEQAERFNAIQKENAELSIMLRTAQSDFYDAQQQNKRYRDKLESIQDIQQWRREEPDYEVLNMTIEALESESDD